MDVPRWIFIFTKFGSSIVGDGEPIRSDPSDIRHDNWGVEPAIAIGTMTRSARAEHALQSVFGYTVAKDVLARGAQVADGQ